ncbi:cobalamin cluster protein [Halonotius terrestris]|uniref:Cobalamin cluster protein n=1 Tax=Halonotius terrestris TaxID=2487750 RepID=A0A8J8PA81_9EURY|nr:CbtA family protein [Halonotius terrestris]TQQ82645.1 cobalamin cluster protein [Halonotius terrestris]
MFFAYLKRGLLAGGVAGIAYGLFMATVANPLVGYLEHVQHGHSHAPDGGSVVAESTTAIVSVGGGLLWALFLGGCFGIALYFLEPALPGRGAAKGFVLAASGFLTISVTPWLVLPPFAPGAEQVLGIDTRFALYAGLVALGGLIAASSVLAYNRVEPQSRGLAVVAGALPVVTAVAVLPTVSPTLVSHPELSADLVAAYRAMVVLSQGSIWVLIAAAFGWLQRRNGVETTVSETAGTTT